jgi:hypothetical protein
MKLKVRQTAEAAVLDLINPGVDGAEDTVLSSRTIGQGQECEITLPDVHEEAGVQIGDVVDTPDAPAPETPAEGGGDQGGGEQPADGGGTEEPPAPEEPKDTSEIPAGCAPGRVVTFRSAESGIDLAAVINGTIASLPQAAIDSGDVPELTSPKRVHLTVFSPFLGEDSRGGTFQVFNVPLAPTEIPEGEEIPKGTWRWPERV